MGDLKSGGLTERAAKVICCGEGGCRYEGMPRLCIAKLDCYGKAKAVLRLVLTEPVTDQMMRCLIGQPESAWPAERKAVHGDNIVKVTAFYSTLNEARIKEEGLE